MNRLPHRTEQTQRHLSDEQFYCLLDDPSSLGASTRLHLNSCIACKSEFASLRGSFSNFRAAASGYAVQNAPPLARRALVADAKPAWMRRPVWAVSFASAAVALGVSLSLMHQHHAPPQAATPAVVAGPVAPDVSDEALLDGIQRDLSTSTPPSLQPLEVASSGDAKNLPN